jgi:dihydroorotase-like cyclic amidohydrolase
LLKGDVRINEGQIAQIAPEIASSERDKIIDEIGLTLLPGLIDPQVHFREPGLEYKEDLSTASHACAKGGVTSFLEMPNTKPLTITQAALDDKLYRSSNKCLVNYGFFIGATAANLPDLLSVNPVCGMKIFMGSSHGALLVMGLSKKYQRRLHILHLSIAIEADLVLVELNTYPPVLREELQTKCGWSPFEGWNLTRWLVTTIVRGQIVEDRGKFNTEVRDRALSFNQTAI